MADFTNMDLSMSERIELGDVRAELSVTPDRGVLELFAELDDPEYTPEDFEKLPSWATGENLGNGVLFYTSDLGKMRELVELAADFLGVKRPVAAPREPQPVPERRGLTGSGGKDILSPFRSRSIVFSRERTGFMDIAISTSIMCSTGSPEAYLRMIAEAGFTHLHWGHQWDTDFLYSSFEIAQCGEWLKRYGLKLLDIHGSEGVEKQWFSPEEYRRRSGVELVLNRVVMLRELDGSGCVMMHLPPNRAIKSTPEDERLLPARVDALRRTFDELLPALERYDARIAVENRRNDSFGVIALLMAEYPAERIGITLDTGHANIDEARGLDRTERFKDRLMALHLNDNDGVGDLHQPPFYGTLDWGRVAKLVASSSYAGRPASFELTMRNTPFFARETPAEEQPEKNIKAFLSDTYDRCRRVADMIAAAGKSAR